MPSQWKLVGSAATLEELTKKISEHFYSKCSTHYDSFLGIHRVSNTKGIITGFRVIEKRGRFRFERSTT